MRSPTTTLPACGEIPSGGEMGSRLPAGFVELIGHQGERDTECEASSQKTQRSLSSQCPELER
jgi:hypothetical protein